jgi:polar amino acid transport system ATP-binding protein
MVLLKRFDLADKCDQYPDRLSGGQQQRVAIIRSLAVNPRVLLLDEITSALDPVLVNEVLSIVRDLKQDGMTMVLATHEMGFATQVADEVCFLESGLILERGSAESVLKNPQNPKTQDFLKRVHEAGRI